MTKEISRSGEPQESLVEPGAKGSCEPLHEQENEHKPQSQRSQGLGHEEGGMCDRHIHDRKQ